MIIKNLQTPTLALGIILIIIMSYGCSAKTTIVLMPDPDGKVGHISVTNDAGSVEIDQPAEATVVKGRQSTPSQPEILSEEKINAYFSEAIAALPDQPQHFILYFETGSTELTDDSRQTLPIILQSIEEKKSQDISVVGHSDTAGDFEYNLRLSKKRASAVVILLKEQGVTTANIKATSHGEENPLVKTADGVEEPRNRRVEVVVR